MGCSNSKGSEGVASPLSKKVKGSNKEMTEVMKFYEDNIKQCPKINQYIFSKLGPLDISQYLPFHKTTVEKNKYFNDEQSGNYFQGYSKDKNDKEIIISILFKTNHEILEQLCEDDGGFLTLRHIQSNGNYESKEYPKEGTSDYSKIVTNVKDNVLRITKTEYGKDRIQRFHIIFENGEISEFSEDAKGNSVGDRENTGVDCNKDYTVYRNGTWIKRNKISEKNFAIRHKVKNGLCVVL
jgi:hypothetical protein